MSRTYRYENKKQRPRKKHKRNDSKTRRVKNILKKIQNDEFDKYSDEIYT